MAPHSLESDPLKNKKRRDYFHIYENQSEVTCILFFSYSRVIWKEYFFSLIPEYIWTKMGFEIL